jgi:hypothetical protein
VHQRLRARVTEEAFRVQGQYELHEGVLFAGVLGYVQEEHIILCVALGGVSLSADTSEVASHRGPPMRTGG